MKRKKKYDVQDERIAELTVEYVNSTQAVLLKNLQLDK